MAIIHSNKWIIRERESGYYPLGIRFQIREPGPKKFKKVLKEFDNLEQAIDWTRRNTFIPRGVKT